MSQHYSQPDREDDAYTLPDIEVFYHQHAKRELCMLNAEHWIEDEIAESSADEQEQVTE